ncbi:MAG TPA: sugar phosphate nucleotidyltransferase [Candidatus Omnitrophota bacterium]|jgi:NDP-sugar pyrophosphorylase family protein|nr:sugar phosphate nucleotidyltransferase [Candidatus Omnitrophota bacterium]
MQAVILAGGQGTRLAPYTLVFPKPMLPVGGQPIIETIIQQLAYYNFKDVVICLGYLGNLIEVYLKNDSRVPKDVNIRYVLESKPLGTAGALSLIDGLEDDFLVINGDILTTLNFQDFFLFHKQKKSSLSIAAGQKKIKMSLGILEIDGQDRVKEFIEKPTYTFQDNMGVYIYNRRALQYIPQNERLDFNILVEKMIQDGEDIFAYRSEDPYFWIDIGQHADFESANQEFEKRRNEFLKS